MALPVLCAYGCFVMTRNEFAWLIVRALGAFILLLIVLDLLTIALTYLNALIVHNRVMSDAVSDDEAINLAIRYGRLIGQIWSLGIGVVFKVAFSYYCFYRGSWIHGLITSKLPSAEQA